MILYVLQYGVQHLILILFSSVGGGVRGSVDGVG